MLGVDWTSRSDGSRERQGADVSERDVPLSGPLPSVLERRGFRPGELYQRLRLTPRPPAPVDHAAVSPAVQVTRAVKRSETSSRRPVVR